MDMIRRSNEILNRLENPGIVRPSAADGEQFPEGSQQTEDTSGNAPESSEPPLQSDPDSVNVYVKLVFLIYLFIHYNIGSND